MLLYLEEIVKSTYNSCFSKMKRKGCISMEIIINSSIGVYIAYGIIAFFFTIGFDLYEENLFYFMPISIYRNTKMNIFGCMFVSVGYIIANPIYCIIMLIVYLCIMMYKLFYIIFHVGRK